MFSKGVNGQDEQCNGVDASEDGTGHVELLEVLQSAKNFGISTLTSLGGVSGRSVGVLLTESLMKLGKTTSSQTLPMKKMIPKMELTVSSNASDPTLTL